MLVELLHSNKRYILKTNFMGPEHVRFDVLEFCTLEQVKDFKNKLELAIEQFERNVVPTA